MRAAAISHAAAERLGWTRTDPRPWGKCAARWEHVDGWQLAHSGHPTDLRPWSLWDPTGDQHTDGALHGDPTAGRNWSRLDVVMRYVAGVAAAAKLAAAIEAAPLIARRVIAGERYEIRVGRLEQLDLFAAGAA